MNEKTNLPVGILTWETIGHLFFPLLSNSNSVPRVSDFEFLFGGGRFRPTKSKQQAAQQQDSNSQIFFLCPLSERELCWQQKGITAKLKSPTAALVPPRALAPVILLAENIGFRRRRIGRRPLF